MNKTRKTNRQIQKCTVCGNKHLGTDLIRVFTTKFSKDKKHQGHKLCATCYYHFRKN
jgi:hypothetical protein